MDGHTLTLQDGRTLAYGEYGAPDGTLLIHCHGSNGSRLERPADEALLNAAGVRLIVPDRPGHGYSDPHPGRTLLDYADDMARLADHAQAERFAISGYSAGGPHAAAVAYRLPERVTWLGLVSSLAPFDRPNAFDGVPIGARLAVWVAQNAFGLLRRTATMQAKAVGGNPDRAVAQFARTLPPRDRELLDNPRAKAILSETIAEAYRQGGDGPMDDIRVYVSPWGFALADIQAPGTVWQGDADKTAVPALGRYLADAIPNATLRLLPGEGHLALYRHWDDLAAGAVDHDAR